ncbi:MAG: hypothetical protein ACJA1C_002718 [Crocinitomicaceae bacterium]|jgi:hypothetical protein
MLAKMSNQFKNKIKRKVLKITSSEMIYRYKQDGMLLVETSVGNSTNFFGSARVGDERLLEQYLEVLDNCNKLAK